MEFCRLLSVYETRSFQKKATNVYLRIAGQYDESITPTIQFNRMFLYIYSFF